MNKEINGILEDIEIEFERIIQKGSRHYLEVSIGEQAAKLGYHDLSERYVNTFAFVPLKAPQKGMKVRIDGRTFVDYAEYDSGIAVPGYLAREAGKSYRTFVAQDSFIRNFT
jgi:hypothetical protein